MSLQKGDKAPDFTLKNTEGNDVSLSELRKGSDVVLLFFPLAFTSVCTDEMCHVRDNMKLYNSLNARVAGISVDSFFTLKEFKKSQNLAFTLLSDFNKDVSEAYNSLYDDYFGMKGVSKRSAFLIGTDGYIKYSEVLEDSGKLPDFDAIVNSIS